MEGKKNYLPRSFTSKSKDYACKIPSDKLLSPSEYSLTGDSPIGVGGCSSVFLGAFKGTAVAVKCYNIANPAMSPAREMLLKEAEAIFDLDHENIIKCLGVCLARGSLLLELAQICICKDNATITLNSLRQLVDAVGDSMDFQTGLKHEALLQIIQGLEYLHSKSIVHGDLKSANVLVSESCDSYQFKLTDFGGSHAEISSKLMSNVSSIQSKKVKIGTTSFEAPEVFVCIEKTCASDVYSFGMVMHELLYYNYSHPWESVFKQCSSFTLASMIIEAVKRGERPIITEDSPYTKIIQLCWKQNPADRPSLATLKLNIQHLEIEARKNFKSSSSETLNHLDESSMIPSGNSGSRAKRQLEFSGNIVNENASDSSIESSEEDTDSAIAWSMSDDSSSLPTALPVSPVLVTEVESSISRVLDDTNNDVLRQSEADICEGEVMKWQGYAMKYLDITLKEFQLEAIQAYSKGKDCVVIQATGAGKSICFQLPALMLNNNEVDLVIVPTVALGMNHQEALQDVHVDSIFISAASTKSDYNKAFKLGSRAVKVIIVSPEFLFGNLTNSGILDKLLENPDRLKFIAVDEAHLIFEWSTFRSTFADVKKLKELLPNCPMIALSATMKPANLCAMRTEILRNPVDIVGVIDRPNVAINILAYRKDSVVEVKKQNSNTWESTAKQIEQLIDGEKAIIYCSYAKECTEICSALNYRNVKAFVYTGKNTNVEKKEVYHKMKHNEIDIVIATKAFGLGINIPSIRHVVHVGLPENLSLWMQEFGRAGRDGIQAHAHLLICEREDLKRLNYWTSNCGTPEEKNLRVRDFIDVWIYMSKVFTGDCLRAYQRRYFEEKGIHAPALTPDVCCTGCQVKNEVSFEPYSKLIIILQTLLFLKGQKINRVYEKQILAWMSGTEEYWMWFYFDSSLMEESTFGCLRETPESVLKLIIKGTLRQCLSFHYVSLEFGIVPGTSNLAKFWSLTTSGIEIANGELNAPILPDPVAVARLLSSVQENCEETPKKNRKRKSDYITAKITAMMNGGPNGWVPLERKQYEMLGFFHDTQKLLYVKDYKLLKGCPIKPKKDYLWEDINLSKKQSFPIFKFEFTEEQSGASSSTDTEFPACPMLMYRAPCNGVKVCEGVNGENCQFTVSKRVHNNRCINHPNSKLMDSGPCGGYFVYLRPSSENDTRRWLAFVSGEGFKAVHSHPCPIRSKLGSKLEQVIEEAVNIDPSKTTKEISKGVGMPCNPSSLSAVASNFGTLANCVKRAKNNLYSGATDRYILENFNILIKNAIDERDAKNAENEVTAQEILKASTPYCRFSLYSESLNYCILATPQMLQVLNEARVVEADVTFPGAKSFPYVLNMVSFNYETLNYQVVARVLMTSLTVSAYKAASILAVFTDKLRSYRYTDSIQAYGKLIPCNLH